MGFWLMTCWVLEREIIVAVAAEGSMIVLMLGEDALTLVLGEEELTLMPTTTKLKDPYLLRRKKTEV